MLSVDEGAMTLDELALVGDPRDGVDGGAITLDELALVGDPCDSGTGASLGDVGTGTDVGTSVWFHHGQRKVW